MGDKNNYEALYWAELEENIKLTEEIEKLNSQLASGELLLSEKQSEMDALEDEKNSLDESYKNKLNDEKKAHEIEKLRENLGRKSSNQTAKQNAANNTTWKSSSGGARKYYHDNSKKTVVEDGCIRQLLILMLLVIGAVAIAFVFFDGKSLIDAINTEQNAYSEHSASPKETNTYAETNYFTGESPISAALTRMNASAASKVFSITPSRMAFFTVSFRTPMVLHGSMPKSSIT